jgi:hypothetical protein
VRIIVSVITLLAAEDVGRKPRSVFPTSEAMDCTVALVYPGIIKLPVPGECVTKEVADTDSSQVLFDGPSCDAVSDNCVLSSSQ